MHLLPWLRRRWPGLTLGLALTSALAALWAGGSLRRLELVGQDLLFRNFSSIPADPRIVLVDIDDDALQTVHEWPWPRRLHAELVETLAEAGAAQIVLDIAFTEPTALRVERPSLGKHRAIDPAETILGELEEVIDDDAELAATIARSGNVHVAMLGEIGRPGQNPETLLRQLVDRQRQRLPTDATPHDQRTAGLPEQWTADSVRALQHEWRIDGVDDGSTSADGLPPADWSKVRRLTARWHARDFLAANPAGSWRDLLAARPGATSADTYSAGRAALLSAYREEVALTAVLASAPAARVGAERCATAYELLPPLDVMVPGVAGVGLVSHHRDAIDGSVRSLPLCVSTPGATLLPALGLLPALSARGLANAEWRVLPGWIEIGDPPSQGVRLPVDDRGLTRIAWHRPADGRWQSSFVHMPAARIMQIASNAAAMEANRVQIGLARAALVRRRHQETRESYEDYERLTQERNQLARARLLGTSAAAGREREARVAVLDAELRKVEAEAVEWLRYQLRLWKDAPDEPLSDAERRERGEIMELSRAHLEAGPAVSLTALNERLAERNTVLRGQLRRELEGRICFVGYTATAVADLVPSPVFSSMPGVMAHANVCNMVLQDRLVRPASPVANLALILIAGCLAALLTSLRGAWFGLLSLVALAAWLNLAAGTAFRIGGWQADWLVAVAAVAVSGAGVTFYRQAIEERARRRFATALGSYTSPAVAARIAERADARDLAPREARVTCFFSDLAGFTALSERLGPARTRLLLNEYLRGVSAALIEQGALVNKFMGDGVFAFFNAPIRPHRRPEVSACAAALAAQDVIRRINRDAARFALAESLVIRVGLATGEAFVGDYGSDAKLDYTCIGDVVNLGARLEAACKPLGAGVLVDAPTRASAGSEYLFRGVGRLRLAGKALSVEAHELLCERDGADPQIVHLADWFERAVEHFQQRRWEACLELLTACAAVRADDPAARMYRDLVMTYRAGPPPQGWDGGVELPGK